MHAIEDHIKIQHFVHYQTIQIYYTITFYSNHAEIKQSANVDW